MQYDLQEVNVLAAPEEGWFVVRAPGLQPGAYNWQVSTELHPRLRKAGFISKIYLFYFCME